MRRQTVQGIDGRIARLRDLYELGDLQRGEYIGRRDELERQKQELLTAAEPVLLRQRTALRALVDDWEEMTVDEKKRLISLVIDEVVVDSEGILELEPHEDWKPYIRSVLRRPTTGQPERKTGVVRVALAGNGNRYPDSGAVENADDAGR